MSEFKYPKSKLHRRQTFVAEDTLNEELLQQIATAFKVFDCEGSETVDVREIGTIIRSLDCWPSEAEIQEIITAVEEEDSSDLVHLSRFQSILLQLLKEKWAKPIDMGKLEDAFKVLDGKNIGTVDSEMLQIALTTEGEPLAIEDLEEIFTLCEDVPNKRFDYNKYISYIYGTNGKEAVASYARHGKIMMEKKYRYEEARKLNGTGVPPQPQSPLITNIQLPNSNIQFNWSEFSKKETSQWYL